VIGRFVRLSAPLTPSRARQVRLHLFLLPVYVWLVFAWTAYLLDRRPAGPIDASGHLKGHDFAHFYVLGEIGRDHAASELFDYAAQAIRLDRLAPGLDLRFFPVHPPQVAMFFSPLARLPYEMALNAWLALSAVIYLACCIPLLRLQPRLNRHLSLAILCCVAAPAFYSLIAAAQTSAFALAWFTLAYWALRRERPVLAGLALGVLAYKPTLGIAVGVVFIAERHWRVVLAGALSAAAQFGASWAYFGRDGLAAYMTHLPIAINAQPLFEQNPWMMHSIWSLASQALPWPAVAQAAYLVASGVTLWLTIRTWRSPAPLEQRFSVLLLATILVDPHVYSYELVVLAPVFIFTAAHAAAQGRDGRWIWLLLYLSYYLPALDGLVRTTRIQWSVIAMAALMVLLTREALSTSSPATEVPP